jgi:virulence factor Mce-like protein
MTSPGRETLSKGQRSVAALAVACLLTAGITVGVRAAYGAFDDSVLVTGRFPRAGQALKVGSDVTYRGVAVGEVRSIDLVGQEVELTLALEPGRRVPDDVEAVIAPKTLFGEKSVELRGGRARGGPFLAEGSELAHTRAGADVEDLIAAAEPVLAGIDTTDLASFMTELTQALQGQGRVINRTFEPTVAAAGLLEDTLGAQLQALDSSARFAGEVKTIGPDLNGAAEQANLLLPTFNRAREDWVRLLRSLRPLADNLGEILVALRPDLDRLLVDGANVTRVVLAREDELADTVHGLATYVQLFAEGLSDEVFEDGSRGAFFKIFVVLDDLNQMLCSLVDPAVPVPPEMDAVFDTIRDTFLGSGELLDCSVNDGTAPSATDDDPEGDGPAAEELAQPYYAAAGAPDSSEPSGLDTILGGVAGEGP